LTVNKGRLIME